MARQIIKNNFEILEYALKIEMTDDNYKGVVIISGETLKDSDGNYTDIGRIDLNSSGLKITDAYASNLTDIINIIGTFTEEFNEVISINLASPLSGLFQLTVTFEKVFEKGVLVGFYKSKYNEDNFFVTQFEDAFARKCFPCVDQPDVKAVFKLTLSVPSKYKVLSNTKCEKEISKIFNKDYEFKKTPKMSTYLLAFVVARNIESIESNDFRIPIRVWAHQDDVQWGKFALKVATRCICFFEEYFHIAYPLEKLDLIGFPAFSSNAMENWGLITFRKTALLLDQNEYTSSQKFEIGETICHEIAHMWFGNLVTMKWWNDLWLNEGFATWASYKAMDAIKDLFDYSDIWCMFITTNSESAMAEDSLSSTHKIEVEVNNPHEVASIFDAISYSKSASLIKSLEEWIGEVNFMSGLRIYLNRYQFSNAESNDLWNCLDEVYMGQVKVKDVMNPWIKKVGFPYIHVVEKDDKLILTQKRFTIGFEPEENSGPWPIPVSIKWIGTDNEEKIVMESYEIEIEKRSEIYKLNSNGFGLYRVWYSDNKKEEILKSDAKLTHSDMLNILNDSWAFGYKLISPFPIEMTKDLVIRSNIDMFISIFGNLKKLCSIFYDDAKRKNLLFGMINGIIARRLETICMDVESCKTLTVDEKGINALFVKMGVLTGYFEVTDPNVHNQFKPYYFESQADNKFQEIKDFYLTSTIPQTKEAALVGISLCKKRETFNKLMQDITFVPGFDFIYLFSALASNINFREEVIGYFIFNYGAIAEHAKDNSLVNYCIKTVCSRLVTGKIFKLLNEFFYNHSDNPKTKASIKIASETLKYKTKIREHFKDISLVE